MIMLWYFYWIGLDCSTGDSIYGAESQCFSTYLAYSIHMDVVLWLRMEHKTVTMLITFAVWIGDEWMVFLFSDGSFQNGKPFYIRNLIEHCHRLYNNGHFNAVTKPIKCMYSTRFVIGSDWNTTNSFQLIFSAINETIFEPLHSVLPFSSRRLSKGLTRISISWKNLSHEAYSNVSIKF